MSYFMKLITNISRKGLKDVLQRWHSKLIMKMHWKFLLLACSGLRMRRKSSWSIKVLLCNFAQAFLKIVFFVKSFRRPYLRSSFDKLLQFYIQSYRYIVNRAVLVYSATDAKSSKTFMKLTTEITGKGLTLKDIVHWHLKLIMKISFTCLLCFEDETIGIMINKSTALQFCSSIFKGCCRCEIVSSSIISSFEFW